MTFHDTEEILKLIIVNTVRRRAIELLEIIIITRLTSEYYNAVFNTVDW